MTDIPRRVVHMVKELERLGYAVTIPIRSVCVIRPTRGTRK
jgi:hypothetical protein